MHYCGPLVHHLMKAREYADSNTRDHIDMLLLVVRGAHHRHNLNNIRL